MFTPPGNTTTIRFNREHVHIVYWQFCGRIAFQCTRHTNARAHTRTHAHTHTRTHAHTHTRTHARKSRTSSTILTLCSHLRKNNAYLNSIYNAILACDEQHPSRFSKARELTFLRQRHAEDKASAALCSYHLCLSWTRAKYTVFPTTHTSHTRPTKRVCSSEHLFSGGVVSIGYYHL